MRKFKERWILAMLLGLPALSMAQQIGIGEYHLPTVIGISPQGITAGPDGAVWFAAVGSDPCLGCVGRITLAGDVTLFQTPTSWSDPRAIVSGPDGALWFTEPDVSQIGRSTVTGVITEYPLPSGGFPSGITVGPDGALWFAEETGNKIGRITTSGSITEYLVPTPGCYPEYIATGSDGALWFTEEIGNKIGRLTTGGSFTEYLVPAAGSDPYGITSGPDGALWFTEIVGNNIGRITTAGAITEHALPESDTGPWLINSGPDGALWFTELNYANIARITTSGAVTEYPVPSGQIYTYGIAPGPTGEIWFTEYFANNIGEAIFETANLTASPDAGGFHTQVTFTGSGYGPNEIVQVYTSGIGSNVIASGTTNGAGSFSTTTDLPQSANGLRVYAGMGLTSGRIGAASFTVTARLILSPNSGAPGSASTIEGYGFNPYETVNLYWQNPGTFLGNGMADVNGTFNGSSGVKFTVPAAAPLGVNKLFGESDTRIGAHGMGVFTVN